MFNIIEKFLSINGEGPASGELSTFIRFKGCNLRCRWCDTKYSYDEKEMEDDEVEIAVQINGKTKTTITIAKDLAKEEAIAAGKAALGDKLTGNIIKEIYVPGRIINIVAK